MSVRKELKNKKGSFGFGADNFLTPPMKIKNSLTTPIIRQESENVLHNLSFKVNFSYRIGKMSFDQPRKRSRSIDNDDMKDGGGDSGGDNGGGNTGGGGGQQPRGGACGLDHQ